MTDADFGDFARAIGIVAVACSKDLDEPTIDVFFKALKDIPLDLVKLAVPELARHHSDRWPSPKKWRQVVDEVQERRATEVRQIAGEQAKKLLTGTVDQSGNYVPTYHCPNCHDSGWRPACGCSTANLFGADAPTRAGECRFHGGVERNGKVYRQPMMACECRGTNPVYLERNPRPIQRYSRGKKEA